MKKIITLIFALAAMIVLPLVANAKPEDRLYDFTDEYYLQNGVNPALIQGRRNGADNASVFDTPFFSYQRNIRAIRTNPAYNQSGSPVFWSVMGDLFVTSFTNDAAGQRAKALADAYVLYVFPRRDQPNPVTLGANRQADIVDLRNGYFSNDPLGLWLHVWVSYTDRAFNDREAQKVLSRLASKNGLALDGTPIVKTVSDIENLISKGYMQKRFRNPNGSEGPMYGICPVIKDPKDGGIAPDAFLSYVRKPDGTPLEPIFLNSFNSLQFTGDWPH